MNQKVRLFLTFLVVVASQFARGEEDWSWREGPFLNHSENFHEYLNTIMYNDNGRWVEPQFRVEELFDVPGGKAPIWWAKKFDNVRFGKNHNLDLNYWWRWTESMMHIHIQSDYDTETNEKFFLKVEDAVRRGAASIIYEFDLNDYEDIEWYTDTFIDKLKRFFKKI